MTDVKRYLMDGDDSRLVETDRLNKTLIRSEDYDSLLIEYAKVDRLWKETAINDSRKHDTIVGLENAVRIVEARVNKALAILDQIDTDGEDHYYSNADLARMILRGMDTHDPRQILAWPEEEWNAAATDVPENDAGNCGLCGQPRARHAEIAPDGKPECRMKNVGNSHHE